MSRVDADFTKKVYDLVAQIPIGRLITYGSIASLCGASWAAWEVGQIAHTGPSDLPWHRVVNKQGGLAKGYPGGKDMQKKILVQEGVDVSYEYTVNIKELLWQPVTAHY
jgi:methylated-DNA-protein-cysteine methyltransferase related protein